MSQEVRLKKKLMGTVVSTKSLNTVVVKVIRRHKHSKYPKFIHSSKKYHAHTVDNNLSEGDVVTIIESRPHSKLKKWEVFTARN